MHNTKPIKEYWPALVFHSGSVVVKSGEMKGKESYTAVVDGRRCGKDDKKQCTYNGPID